MTPAAILDEARFLASLAPSAALSDSRWWTSYQIAGICIRAAQWVDRLPRDDNAIPFVWMPVRSRQTPRPITLETVREILDTACCIFHEWLDRGSAEGSVAVARGRAWAMLYALDGAAVEAFGYPPAPEFVPGGPTDTWIEKWSADALSA